jgi:NAD(P)-dependent dehydrogenase (short-subunit alcohol dehydrogenase family)
MENSFLNLPIDDEDSLLHPVGRVGNVEEVVGAGAGAVLYLCSDAAGFTTGVTLPIDGGSTAI